MTTHHFVFEKPDDLVPIVKLLRGIADQIENGKVVPRKAKIETSFDDLVINDLVIQRNVKDREISFSFSGGDFLSIFS